LEVGPSFQERLLADKLPTSCHALAVRLTVGVSGVFFTLMFKSSQSFTWCKIAVLGHRVQFWQQYDICNPHPLYHASARAHTHTHAN